MTEKHITQADAEVFNMYGLARNDKAHALNVLNYLRTMIYIKYLSLSNWHGDRHRLQELRYIKKLIRSNGDILAKGTTEAKNMRYHFFSILQVHFLMWERRFVKMGEYGTDGVNISEIS